MTQAKSPALQILPAQMPANASADGVVADVLAYLQGVHAAVTALRGLAEEKLGALRTADAAALEALARREEAVLKAMLGDAQARTAVLARAAQALRLPGARPWRVRDIAAAVPEPGASHLLSVAAGLEAASRDLQRKNRLVADVARDLQGHVRAVLASFADAAREDAGYGPLGERKKQLTRTWVDAVG